MHITSRRANKDDLDYLVGIYPTWLAEQLELRPLWDNEGLADPIEDSLLALLDDDRSLLAIGAIDGVPLGFVWATIDEMQPQFGDTRIGTIRLIYVEPEARGVGIGHEMATLVLDAFGAQGVTLFDARVSPGHRNAKNFFEAHGFSARLIVMHHNAGDD